jgi:hypothetical protein
MLETIAAMSVGKLIVVGLIAPVLLVICGVILLSIAAVLGPGIVAVRSKRSSQYHEYPELASGPGVLRVGIVAFSLGIGIIIVQLVAEPSVMMYLAALLVSGGVGLIASTLVKRGERKTPLHPNEETNNTEQQEQ